MILFAPGLCLLGVDTSCIEIALVPQKNKGKALNIIGSGILNETVLPFVQVIEAVRVCQVICQCAAVGSTVEGKAQRLELFLTGSIPDLECDYLAVDLDFLLGEVGANRWLRVSSGLTVHVLLEKRGLADA